MVDGVGEDEQCALVSADECAGNGGLIRGGSAGGEAPGKEQEFKRIHATAHTLRLRL